MRYLVVLRGLPASGKSTFVKEMNLTNYTLSSDKFRLTYRSPTLDINGKLVIDQSSNAIAWANLYAALEERMERGEFTVIDATHITKKSFNYYNHLCEKYFYKQIVVEFKASVDTCIEQDNGRIFAVGSKVIKDMANRWEELPETVNKVLPENLVNTLLTYCMSKDFSNRKVYVVGSMQGHYYGVKQYIEHKVDLDKDILIFAGNYFMSGKEEMNKLIFDFLSGLMKSPNVFVCMGDDIKWIMREHKRMVPVSLDVMNQFLAKLIPCLQFFHGEQHYIVTHGNLSAPIINVFMPETMYIDGVGEWSKDVKVACDTFNKYTSTIQIFSKNYEGKKVKINPKCYNIGMLRTSLSESHTSLVIITDKGVKIDYTEGVKIEDTFL